MKIADGCYVFKSNFYFQIKFFPLFNFKFSSTLEFIIFPSFSSLKFFLLCTRCVVFIILSSDCWIVCCLLLQRAKSASSLLKMLAWTHKVIYGIILNPICLTLVVLHQCQYWCKTDCPFKLVSLISVGYVMNTHSFSKQRMCNGNSIG